MKTYIGTKVVNATPMDRQEYNDYRGWELPENENGNDEGYLVEYLDGGKPNHAAHSGYISWSPKEQFDKAYRELNGLDFGEAIRALKAGKRVTREGWNGKGMWLSLSGVANIAKPVKAEHFWSAHNAAYAASQPEGVAKVLPCITMKTATGEILMGWLASQSDMLAEDWMVLE